MTAFDDELAIEAAEARLAAPLDEHAAAVVAAARSGGRRPPWPEALRSSWLARLPTPSEPRWAARARTLTRWATAARVAADPEVMAAAAEPASLAGLASRHRALRSTAARLGWPSTAALIEAIFGVAPATPPLDAGLDCASPPLPSVALPPWTEVLALLADHAGVDRHALVAHADGAAAVTVEARHATTSVFPPVDDLTSLTVAAHELGHGIYAVARRGLPLGLAAPPSRAVDEAVAAWAVRSLEEWLPPAWAVVARWRRQRGERARARLAAMERAALAGGHVDTAWRRHIGGWRPALAEAILAEPGVAAAYAAADALALAPTRGQIARWGADGAALVIDAGLA